jgi:type IV pilus assembly protein PilM
MFNFTNNKARPIGLDIGHSFIRMIQLARSGANLRIIAAEETRFDIDIDADDCIREEFTVSAIKEMLARGNFCGKDVISSLSNESLKIKSLRLDTTDAEQIEQLLRKDVAQQFDLDADTDEIRYMVAGNVYQGDEVKNEVIFFGTDKESISRHISMLKQAGLNPVAIDAVPCALFRCLQSSLRRQEDQDLVSVFVDVGNLFTTIIIGRGQQLTFVKQIPIAGRQLNMEVASQLDVDFDNAIMLRSKLRNSDPESIDTATRQAVVDAMSRVIEELAKEISLCFRYYAVTFRGNRPAEAIFAGGEAYESVLLDTLKEHLDIETRIAYPFRGFDLTGTNFALHENSPFCEWAVAVGLGIKGWDLLDYGTENHERNRLYPTVV